VESRDKEGRKRKEIEGVEKKAWLGEPSTDAMGRWGRKEEDREHPPGLRKKWKNGSR
jgi:hypothetical protein